MFTRIINIPLAVLILLLSAGVSIDLHYCKNELRKISLFSSAGSCHDNFKSCCASRQQKTCHREDHDDNCCKNETRFVKYDQQYTVEQVAQVGVKLPVAACGSLALFDIRDISENSTEYLNYKPPLIPEDIPVLLQTFLC
ncbi:MAG: hypothetical protein KatS3mg031_1281 [Chitinophagales bacterium]|nr:MAG: hypothetical protein KatS3mg031_1281 [Chitinophagales bacterium]